MKARRATTKKKLLAVSAVVPGAILACGPQQLPGNPKRSLYDQAAYNDASAETSSSVAADTDTDAGLADAEPDR
jgi:hypothetical protein